MYAEDDKWMMNYLLCISVKMLHAHSWYKEMAHPS